MVKISSTPLSPPAFRFFIPAIFASFAKFRSSPLFVFSHLIIATALFFLIEGYTLAVLKAYLLDLTKKDTLPSGSFDRLFLLATIISGCAFSPILFFGGFYTSYAASVATPKMASWTALRKLTRGVQHGARLAAYTLLYPVIAWCFAAAVSELAKNEWVDTVLVFVIGAVAAVAGLAICRLVTWPWVLLTAAQPDIQPRALSLVLIAGGEWIILFWVLLAILANWATVTLGSNYPAVIPAEVVEGIQIFQFSLALFFIADFLDVSKAGAEYRPPSLLQRWRKRS